MTSHPTPIDEQTLAAFLAGRLSGDRRAEVISYLANNADARELLCMAQDALHAAEGLEADQSTPADAPLPAPAERPAAAPSHTSRPGLKRVNLSRYALAACIVFLIGLGLYATNPSLRNAFRDAPDTFRDTRGAEDGPLQALVTTTPTLSFQWNAVAEAYAYRLVIIDTEDVVVVAEHETPNTRLGDDDAFVRALDDKLTAGRTYSVTIDAVDARNRTLRSSSPTRFTAPD